MLKKLSTISILVACSTVYAAGTGEAPPAAPAATPPAAAEPAKPTAATPAAEPAKPAAATPAAEPAKPAAATPAAEPAKPAAAPAVSLSGKWSFTNMEGDVTIEQTGNKITGTYTYKDDDDVTQEGKLEGIVEGNTVKAKWWERPKVGKGEESRGDLEWKIADEGKMLAGWYRNEGEKDKEDFNLKR